MKKVILCVLLLLLFVPTTVFAGCWYLDLHGEHAFEQKDFAYATCTTDGYYFLECNVCGLGKKVVTQKKTGHKWKVLSVTDPTCTKDGKKKKECEYCHKVTTETIDATGHSWKSGSVLREPTCTKEGLQKVTCKVCGKTDEKSIPKTAHHYGEWQVTTPATDHSTGTRTRTCRDCDAEDSEIYYPEGTLMRGKEKLEEVRVLQQELIDLNVLNDKADGIFGKKTEKAVRAYQVKNGFEETGIAFPQTIDALHAEWEEEFMGISATEEPIIIAEPTPAAAPSSCIVVKEGDQIISTTYCEKHMQLLEKTNALVGTASDEISASTASTEARMLWQNELYAEYDNWMNSVATEDAAAIAHAKTVFDLYLKSQENNLKAQGLDSKTIDENITQLLIAQCAEICAIEE